MTVVEPQLQYDPGSFRDRHARVFHADGRVLRALDRDAADQWQALSQTDFFRRRLGDGTIVATEARPANGFLPQASGTRWTTVLTHERIPFLSYPYEWSFGMLKDAALLHLDLMLDALDEGMILKDSSPFNYQWIGSRPVLIDVGSFVSLRSGESWVGYRQFCRMFLYPLLLEAYKGIPFQPWLRGSIDGIGARDCRRVMSVRDLLRPGVLKHVHLQSRFELDYASHTRDVRSDLRGAGFHAGLIKANVQGLKRLIEGLHIRDAGSTWSDYTDSCHYQEQDDAAKVAFVEQVTSSRHWGLVWDIGANTGRYSRIAAKSADCVLAIDGDGIAVDRMYEALKSERSTNVLPLVCNVAEPSPALGWRNRERGTLPERGTPDLTLCLAVVHHLAIGVGIPLPEVVEWLASLRSSLLVEFVTKDDPMVQRLLRNKEDAYDDYELPIFEQSLERAFRVANRRVLSSGTRILYSAERRQ